MEDEFKTDIKVSKFSERLIPLSSECFVFPSVSSKKG